MLTNSSLGFRIPSVVFPEHMFFQGHFLKNFEYFSETFVDFGKDLHKHPFYSFHKSYAQQVRIILEILSSFLLLKILHQAFQMEGPLNEILNLILLCAVLGIF